VTDHDLVAGLEQAGSHVPAIDPGASAAAAVVKDIAASLIPHLGVDARGQQAGENHIALIAAAEGERLAPDREPLPCERPLKADNCGYHRIGSRSRFSTSGADCLTVTERPGAWKLSSPATKRSPSRPTGARRASASAPTLTGRPSSLTDAGLRPAPMPAEWGQPPDRMQDHEAERQRLAPRAAFPSPRVRPPGARHHRDSALGGQAEAYVEEIRRMRGSRYPRSQAGTTV
jgi:hypothetical protein